MWAWHVKMATLNLLKFTRQRIVYSFLKLWRALLDWNHIVKFYSLSTLKMKFDHDLRLNLWYDPIGYFGKTNSTLGSVVPLAMFSYFTIINNAIYFVVKPSGLMFLRLIDHRWHHMQLFPMVANHRSSNAMFAMYRSSVSSGIHGFHFRPPMGGLM